MKNDENSLFQETNQEIDNINEQRRVWLYASSFTFVGIVFLVFAWDLLDSFHSKTVWWFILSLILIISINWWYWTMRMISKMLNHQKIEFEIIHDVIVDIRSLKKEIKELGHQEVDNNKK
jgi:ABC-type proline/glycine betaine transport system permease subunit